MSWPRRSRTRTKRVVTGFETYPRLPIREILAVLLLVAAGITALVVNATRSHAEVLRGPVANRLKQAGGVYSISFPVGTRLTRAWTLTMKPFPSDTKVAAEYDAAGCQAVILASDQLAHKFYPGLVVVEFQTTPKQGGYAVFDKKNVNTAIVTLLDSAGQRPSC